MTVEVRGARFHEEALLKLVRPGIEEIEPVRYEVIDATRIIATFDLRDREKGLYDLTVINPDGAEATLPYRFLVERALPIDVTIGLGGPRIVPAGQTGLYGISLQSLTNVDTPYVYFEFGVPELGENAKIYGLPYLSYASNVGGAPDGVREDVPWISLDSEVNRDGYMLAPGYAMDVIAGGYVGMSFTVTTYPGLQALIDRDLAAIRVALEDARSFWSVTRREALITSLQALAAADTDPTALRAQLNLAIANLLEALEDATAEEATGITAVIEVLQSLESSSDEEIPHKCVPLFAPFRFNVVAAATPMTRAEFVARQSADARALREAVLADATASVALRNLAADEDTWVAAYLAALEDGGLLRPEDEAPPIRTQPKVVSVVAVLSSGVLIGPAGQQIESQGDLVAFFAQVRQWYGDTPGQLAEIAAWDLRESDECGEYNIPIPAVPEFEDYDLGLSHQTYFATFNVFTPYGNVPDSAYASVAASDELTPLQLQKLFQLAAQSATQASITGPQGYGERQFLPAERALPYTIRFENPADATTNPSEIRIVTQLDPGLSPRSFRLGDLQLGDIRINVPADRSNFQADFDLRNSRGYVLRVSAGIDTATATATWLLQAIDPMTGELVRDPAIGLLPPNVAGGQGVGSVGYTVTSAFGLEQNREIHASARVIFNTAAPLDTPELVQFLDVAAPRTTLDLARVGGANYEVRWNAVEEADGSGVKHTTIYVARDGGDWEIWLRQSTESFAVFQGEAGHSYEFVAVSTDNAGNQERPVTVATLPDDGSQVNLGTLPDVGSTTQDTGIPPTPSETPSTNVLFVQAQQGIPAAPSTRPSQFGQVLAPFTAEVFATGIAQSHAGIGPLAILVQPDGSVVVSGGANRGALYRYSEFGGRALNPFVVFDEPVYDMAYDLDGRLWATTGGGQLLQLDPESFAVIGRYGESLTQALAVDPSSGKIYVSSGDGIEIFDPLTFAFRHFSNTRVDDLAFAPDGELWATTWPRRGDIVTFDAKGRAQVQLRLDAAVDSIAFGRSGTALAGLLFVGSHAPVGDPFGSSLVMVDLATLQRIEVASNGPLAEALAIDSRGRVLIANSQQVDVLMPLTPPAVVRTTPADEVVVPLPLASIRVVFDQDMDVSGAARASSVLNPENYTLRGANGGPVAITSIAWDEATRTVTLGFDALQPDFYSLTVAARVQSAGGLALSAPYQVDFVGVQDFSSLVRLDFVATRSDRADGTLSFDVRVTNIADYNLQTPLMLVLDPGRYFQGVALDAGISDDGLWLLDIGAGLVDGVLAPGDSTVVRTVTLADTEGQRTDLGYGIYAVPYANRPPVISSSALTQATAGQGYSYTVAASDPDGVVLSYVLLDAPEGMTLGADGVLRWDPTVRSDARAPVVLRVYDTRGSYAEQSFTIAVDGGNAAPSIADLPDGFELRAGALFQIGIDAVDADGQVVTVYIDNLPPGAIFDSRTRVLSWLPGHDQAGDYPDLRIVASDGITSTVKTLSLLVRPANAAPLIAGVPARSVREGDPVSVRLSAFDPNGDTVRFESPNLPEGARLNPTTGLFEWTPAFTQAGRHEIALWATDGLLRSETIFRIDVTNVNGVPVFDRFDDWTVVEGQGISFRAFALDPDNPGFVPRDRLNSGELIEVLGSEPSVTITVEGLPEGASFDAETWMFDWTPGYVQAGTYTVRFTATDDGDGTGVPNSVTVEVPLTVHNANRAPLILPFGNQSVARGETLEVALDISDPDGNPLSITTEGLPDFASIVTLGDGSRVLRIAPGAQDRGDHVVTLTATDDGDGGGERMRQSSSYTFVITAESPSEAPVLAPIGDKVAVFGELLRFTIRASDLDQDTLVFSADALPPGATLTPGVQYGTVVFEWTPTAADAGEYTLTFTVTDDGNDGEGEIGSDARTIRIVARASNAAPLLLPVGDRTVAEGETLTVQLEAIDSDGDTLTYSAANLPPGARLDAVTGVLTYAPNYFQAGSYGGIVISVSDGHSTVTENLAIEVTNSNRGPLLAGIAPLGGQELRVLQFSLLARDPDGDAVVYSLLGYTRDGVAQPGTRPEGVFFDAVEGRFEWTPGQEQAGEYVFRFGASDLDGASDEIAVVVRVADINRAPVIGELYNRQVVLGEALAFTLAASDPDAGETLRFSAVGLPEGATLDAVSGEFAWTPGAGQAGDYLVMVSLSDGKTTTVRPLSLRATLTPQPPTALINLTPGFPVVPGQLVAATVLADAYSGVLTRRLFLDGVEVALDQQNRALISAPASGTYVLTAVVTDRDGLTATVERVLRVRDPSDAAAPELALDAALNGLRIGAVAAIGGRVADANLDAWRLEIARAGSDDWVLLAEGRETIDGVLATLDPTRLQTGFYMLRLSASDVAGRVAETTATVEIATVAKSGRYLRRDTDFAFSMGGHTLDFTRRYDSLDAANAGSFGFGWSLALRDVRLETDVPSTGAEASGVYNPLRAGTRLFLTAPDGQRLGFTFAPQKSEGRGFVYWTPAWVADDPGSGWELGSLARELQRGADRFYDLQTGEAYNPAAFGAESAQYVLVGPDGTRYEIAAERGITGIVFGDGVRLAVSDSGITGPDNQSLRWVRDASGALRQATTPDGRTFLYGYDIDGNLVSVRNLEAASSLRYGYAEPQSHRLTIATGASAGEAIGYGDVVAVTPVAADLGAALGYLTAPRSATLVAGEQHLYSLATRDSEVVLAAGGAVLLGVVVTAADGSAFDPALPQLLGHAAIASRVEDGRAFALYRIDRAALDLLRVGGSGAGEYTLELFVAGDVNRDAKVDAADAALLAELRRTGGYDRAADFDGDGTLDASDTQLLFASLGYGANAGPAIDAATRKTHVDLDLNWNVDRLISDPEGDPLYVGILGATNGTVRMAGDGRTLHFTPDAGFAGTATVTVYADDGFTKSAPVTLTIEVSDARLTSIDFDLRAPKIRAGDQWLVQLTGDFEDEQDVALPLSYVQTWLSEPAVAALNGRGELVGLADGTAVLRVSRGGVSAATAVSVGEPQTALEMFTYYFGIDAYPDTIALLPGDSRQMVVQWGPEMYLNSAADGTYYVIGDEHVATVDADGRVVARNVGATTVTVINRSGEQVVPVVVVAPSGGEVGSGGGVVLGEDGQMVAFGAGQVSDGTTVTITSLAEEDLAVEVPAIVEFGNAFRLDIDGSAVSGPMQIAVPVDESYEAGDQVYFFMEIESDITGTPQKYWAAMDTGVVGDDGYARTTSPPWPGLSRNGNILMARANQPVRTVTLDLSGWEMATYMLALAAGSGSLVGVVTFGSLATALILLPMALQAANIQLYASYGGQTLSVNVPVDVGQDTTGSAWTCRLRSACRRRHRSSPVPPTTHRPAS